MKKIRVVVREVSKLTYEIEVDDDFNDLHDFDKVADYLWEGGVAPDYIENEVEDESIEDAWAV